MEERTVRSALNHRTSRRQLFPWSLDTLLSSTQPSLTQDSPIQHESLFVVLQTRAFATRKQISIWTTLDFFLSTPRHLLPPSLNYKLRWMTSLLRSRNQTSQLDCRSTFKYRPPGRSSPSVPSLPLLSPCPPRQYYHVVPDIRRRHHGESVKADSGLPTRPPVCPDARSGNPVRPHSSLPAVRIT